MLFMIWATAVVVFMGILEWPIVRKIIRSFDDSIYERNRILQCASALRSTHELKKLVLGVSRTSGFLGFRV